MSVWVLVEDSEELDRGEERELVEKGREGGPVHYFRRGGKAKSTEL